ncbi:MAG: NAD(P)-dependent oxidoreductase [Acidobacteria bacterium]|nr:NAD(P)-dependent oxidoreductase [Acidobacteriota bacterium]
MTATKAAFIGLGTMGYPMAGHLAKAGHEITVFNRTRTRAEAWVREHGGRLGGTPAEAAAGAHLVFTCVGNDDDLRVVVYGTDGAFAGMDEGAVLVDHTTASGMVAREVGRAAAERFRHELELDAFAGLELVVQRVKGDGTIDVERQMVQPDDVLAVERNRFRWVCGLPQGDHDAAVGEKDSRIIGHFTNLGEAQRIDEEAAGPQVFLLCHLVESQQGRGGDAALLAGLEERLRLPAGRPFREFGIDDLRPLPAGGG